VEVGRPRLALSLLIVLEPPACVPAILMALLLVAQRSALSIIELIVLYAIALRIFLPATCFRSWTPQSEVGLRRRGRLPGAVWRLAVRSID
jgi:hypothetical protein